MSCADHGGTDDRDVASVASVLARALGVREPLYPPVHLDLSPGEAEALISEAWSRAASDLGTHGYTSSVALRSALHGRIREVRDEIETAAEYHRSLQMVASKIEREAKEAGEATRIGDSITTAGAKLAHTSWRPLDDGEHVLAEVRSDPIGRIPASWGAIALSPANAAYAADLSWTQAYQLALDRADEYTTRTGYGGFQKGLYYTFLFRYRVLTAVLADYELFGAVTPYEEGNWGERDPVESERAVAATTMLGFWEAVATLLHNTPSISLMKAVRRVESFVHRHQPGVDIPYRIPKEQTRRRDDHELDVVLRGVLTKRRWGVRKMKASGLGPFSFPPWGGGIGGERVPHSGG